MFFPSTLQTYPSPPSSSAFSNVSAMVGRDIFIDLTMSNRMADDFLLCNFTTTSKNYWQTSHKNGFFFIHGCWKDDAPHYWCIHAFLLTQPWYEMQKQDDLHCRTHSSVGENTLQCDSVSIRSAAWLLTKTRPKACILHHTCWHKKHFHKSHQITAFKVLHKVSEGHLFFFSSHEIINEPKTGTATVNYSDSTEEGMSHQFTTFFSQRARKQTGEKNTHTQPQEEKRDRVKQRLTNAAVAQTQIPN